VKDALFDVHAGSHCVFECGTQAGRGPRRGRPRAVNPWSARTTSEMGRSGGFLVQPPGVLSRRACSDRSGAVSHRGWLAAAEMARAVCRSAAHAAGRAGVSRLARALLDRLNAAGAAYAWWSAWVWVFGWLDEYTQDCTASMALPTRGSAAHGRAHGAHTHRFYPGRQTQRACQK